MGSSSSLPELKNKLQENIAGIAQQAKEFAEKNVQGAKSVLDGNKVSTTLGAPRPLPQETITGGRRHKTRKHKHKGKKTKKRSRRS